VKENRRSWKKSQQSCKPDANFLFILAGEARSDFLSALALFCNRRDKEWGMVDCVSFVVMQERWLTNALTTDEHFEQAGFRILLRAEGTLSSSSRCHEGRDSPYGQRMVYNCRRTAVP
jgi:hypothetical protein